MKTRKATIEDLPAIALLFDQYRQFYKQPSDLGGATKFLLSRFEKNESAIFVAIHKEKIIGFSQLYPSFSSVAMKRTWILNDLFVAPDDRHFGAGRFLLEAAVTYAREKNAPFITLQTAVDNHAAQQLYERNGWVRNDKFYTYLIRL